MGRKRIYTLNEDYFDNINTPMKVYLIGFIFADGGIFGNYLTIGIHKRDVEILEQMKVQLNYNGPLYYDKTNTYVKLTIHSKKIKEALGVIGIVSNKTYVTNDIPLIPDELFNHFLLGFFDGDGSIYKSSKKLYDYTVNFTNNKSVLIKIKNKLSELDVSSSTIRRRWDNDISCMLDIRGSLNIEAIYNIFYKTPPPFFFHRKKVKFDKFLNSLTQLSKRKLKKSEIIEIKKQYLANVTQKEISIEYGIPYSTVRGVIQRLRKTGEL